MTKHALLHLKTRYSEQLSNQPVLQQMAREWEQNMAIANDELIAEEFKFVCLDILNQQIIEMIRQGVIRYTAFERYPEKFLFFKDMVVVMGSEIVVPAAGAPNAGKKLQRRYTNVWMKLNGHWKLTIRHANNVQ